MIALLLCGFGCATSRPIISLGAKTESENIGITGVNFQPETSLCTPAKGTFAGLGRGATIGMLGTMGSGVYGGPGTLIIGIILSPVGAVVGGMYGAGAAEPAERIEAYEIELNRTIAECNAQKAMLTRFSATASRRTGRTFVEIAGMQHTTQAAEPEYTSIAHNGIETVMEIAVLKYGLEGAWTFDPPLYFFMTAKARVLKTADGSVLYSNIFQYKSDKKEIITFADWAADHAFRFRRERDTAFSTLSERIVEELFQLPVRTIKPLDQEPPTKQLSPMQFRFL
jgi:outer membrane lipoprotein SlyB